MRRTLRADIDNIGQARNLGGHFKMQAGDFLDGLDMRFFVV